MNAETWPGYDVKLQKKLVFVNVDCKNYLQKKFFVVIIGLSTLWRTYRYGYCLPNLGQLLDRWSILEKYLTFAYYSRSKPSRVGGWYSPQAWAWVPLKVTNSEISLVFEWLYFLTRSPRLRYLDLKTRLIDEARICTWACPSLLPTNHHRAVVLRK